MLARLRIWWETWCDRAVESELRTQVSDLKYDLKLANKELERLKEDNFHLSKDLKMSEAEVEVHQNEIELLTLIIERNKHRILMDTGVDDERRNP